MSLGKVSVIGRNTSGVKFMDLPKNGDTVIASIAKVRESSEDEGEESEETDS